MKKLKRDMMEREDLGCMDFHGSVDITDPCYNRDVWCRMNDIEVSDGDYSCSVWLHTDRGVLLGKPYIDTSVGVIGIYLDGVIPPEDEMEEIGEIGVDAGIAGFFHHKPDYDDQEWSSFCDRVSQGRAWLLPDGFASSSGYGDGGYSVYAYRQDGMTTALEIRFLC